MSSLLKVERHRRSLGEIREILNSMKSLAYIETRKLQDLVTAQRAVTEQIDLVAEDLISFHPTILPQARPAQIACITVGTERGFCGDLNQRLVNFVKTRTSPNASDVAVVLAIGRKLHLAFEGDNSFADSTICIDGPAISEEVTAVLYRVIKELDSVRKTLGITGVSVVYQSDGADISERELLPPFSKHRNSVQQFTQPPLLNMRPDDLFYELTDQYLFATLYEILFTSLLNENQRRVMHLGAAVQHIDDKSIDLSRKANVLRQEAITEEIEVILLGSMISQDPISDTTE